MKRKGYLIEEIADLNNLMLAFYKAAKGKTQSPPVMCYREHLAENLQRLRSQLITGSVDVGKYNHFKIFDPKERMICAAAFDERVLHHALMNVCHPVFERHLISDSYATRIGKGTYKALEKAKKGVGQYEYVAKLDIRKYFDSIPHDLMIEKLGRIFKDKTLLDIFRAIIESYQSDYSDKNRHRGIPIGNLTSQYLANHYLSATDHFIKERLRVPLYIRYMDDMLLMGDDRQLLREQVQAVRDILAEEGLELKPVVLNRASQGVSFLGYRLYPHRMLLNRRSKLRFRTKMFLCENNLNEGEWSEQEYQNHVIPLLSFVQHAYTKRFRKEILEGSNRVLRGGSWNNNARNCRVAYRNNNSPDNRNNNIGFRLALAQNDVSNDLLMNRESSCVSAKETENEQSCIAGSPILVGSGTLFENLGGHFCNKLAHT